MLFEIHSPNSGRTSHCGVMEFVADEGQVYLPNWVRSAIRLPFPPVDDNNDHKPLMRLALHVMFSPPGPLMHWLYIYANGYYMNLSAQYEESAPCQFVVQTEMCVRCICMIRKLTCSVRG